MTPTQTINAFYQAIIDNNVDAIRQSYAFQEEKHFTLKDSSLINKGFSKIAENFDGSLLSIDWLETPQEKIGENLASIAGMIKFVFSVSGKSFEKISRASFILVRNDKTWKIKREHLFNTLVDSVNH